MNEKIKPYGLLLMALLSTVGCGGESVDPNRPKVVPVQGVINFNGQPLADAVVVFRSTTGTLGATGRTDGQGHFDLQTFDPRDGAVPGAYQVMVTKFEDVATRAKQADNSGDGGELKSLIPLKYQDPKRSGLSADVMEGRENRFTFDLKN